MQPTIEIPSNLSLLNWSDDRRRANLRQTLEVNPNSDSIWVFGYGSLIWDPRFEPIETRRATLYKHRRSFCFWTTRGRGTPARPGLGLAIVPCGGSIQGLVYKLDPRFYGKDLEALWKREMNNGVYHAEWRRMETFEGKVYAIVYVANIEHPNYCGELPLEEQARIMASAKGLRGWSYEYLGHLVKEFNRLGIVDTYHCALYDRILEIVANRC